MKRSQLFLIAILVMVLALALAVYYAIPGVYHILVSGSHPPLDPQPTHIVLFVVLAVLAGVLALVNRPMTHKR